MARKNLIAGIALAAIATSACITPALASDKAAKELSNPHHEFVTGPAPAEITSAIDNGYACMAKYVDTYPVKYRYAVGRITDQTGKFSNEASAGGFEVTQGVTSEVYSAFDKLGLKTVERTDTDIVNFDLGVWKQHLLGDSNFPGMTDPSGHLIEKGGEAMGKGLAQYHGGQIQSADYYVTGAITGINYNVWSGGGELFIQQIGAGKRIYSMDIDMDLRIVDAHTLEVVKAIPIHKVVTGYETEAGIYNFLGRYLIDFNAGSKAQEPRELGVRAAMEDAVLTLVGATMRAKDGSNFGQACAHYGEETYGDVRAVPPPAIAAATPVAPPVAPPPPAMAAAPTVETKKVATVSSSGQPSSIEDALKMAK